MSKMSTSSNAPSTTPPAGRTAADIRKNSYLLAGVTGLDPRTCRRAIERGVRAVKAHHDREMLMQAAKNLGIVLPSEAA